MRKRYALCALVLGMGIFRSAACASAGHQENLYCESPAYDFGTIAEGQSVSHSFRIENRSHTDIAVTRIMTTCGCVIVENKQFTLRPAGGIDLPVRLHSGGYGNRSIEKKILLLSDSGSTAPLLELVMKGQVLRLSPEDRLSAFPTSLNILNTPEVPHTLLVKGPTDSDIDVRVSGPPCLKVKTSRQSGRDMIAFGQWLVEFSLTKRLSSRTKCELIVKSSLSSYDGELRIPVTIEPKPLVRMSPPVLFANLTSQGPWKGHLRATLLSEMPVFLDTSLAQSQQSSSKRPDPSSDCPLVAVPSTSAIQVTQLPMANAGEIAYDVTIAEAIQSPQWINICVGGLPVAKAPIIIAGPQKEAD